MAKRIFEKLEKVNAKDEIIFKVEYKGKVLQQRAVEIPEYAKIVMEDKDLQLYYFFKDMTLAFEEQLEEKIIQVHKKLMWKEIDKGGQDGGTGGETK